MSTTHTTTTTEPLDERGSAVRFETQCVVIPDPAHHSPLLPRVVTKSYTLPLWKRRPSSAGGPTSAPPLDVSCDENPSHLVLRVPVPTFSRKPNSTTRGADHLPLPPCLVHRSLPSGSPPGPDMPSINRHARAPRKTSPSPPRPDIVTVPLRPCCAACQSVTEAAFVNGDAWPVHFSRSASRRRSASVDATPRTITVAGSAASASYGVQGVAISVDEIDKRRRSSDSGLLGRPEVQWSKHASEWGETRVPLIRCRTTASDSSFTDVHPLPSPSRLMPATPRIPEESDDEDESELFPLPSPKRTPTASPAPSVAGSVSSLAAAPPNHGATASPAPSICSGDSVAVLPPSKRHFLAPPCASSSSLSLPKLPGSTTDLADDPPRPPSPSLLTALPSLSGRHRSRSPSPRRAFVPPISTTNMPPTARKYRPQTPAKATPARPIPIPSPRAPPQWTHSPPTHSPPQTRLPWRSKRPASADGFSTRPFGSLTSPSSPALASRSPKSFSMTSPLQLFAGVLRGVGSGGGFAPPGM